MSSNCTVQIADNLFFEDNESFGKYSRYIVYDILRSIDINFSECLGLESFSTCKCVIRHQPENPMCCQSGTDHYIYLSAHDNYWCKWVYQFAHEYCHHLINGKLSGEITGLIWFEESICELSSMFHLYKMYEQWSKDDNQFKSRYAPSVRDYLYDLVKCDRQLLSQTLRGGWLNQWMPILSEPRYHRDYYNVIAARIFSLFCENPYLWKIILHFGDMRQWKSLESLFDHLIRNSHDEYSKTLLTLRDTLLY